MKAIFADPREEPAQRAFASWSVGRGSHSGHGSVAVAKGVLSWSAEGNQVERPPVGVHVGGERGNVPDGRNVQLDWLGRVAVRHGGGAGRGEVRAGPPAPLLREPK